MRIPAAPKPIRSQGCWRWPARWAAASLAVLSVAGCSVVSVAYDRLPTLVVWRLNRLWDLEPAQRRGLETAARGWHAWHRAEQLPAIAELLQRWQGLAEGTPDAATVCREADAVRALLQEASERTVEGLARWLPTLTDAQLAHWQARLADADEEWHRDWGHADLERGVGLQRTRERLEMFYGRLDATQRRWLRAQLQSIPYRPDLVWAERRRRQADWLETARRLRGQSPEVAVAQVRALWVRTWRSPDPELAAYQDALWRAGCRWLAEWHTRQATPEQRARAVSRLQAYEREVRALLNDRGIDDRAIGVASRP
jgi:hypothetical protein